MDNNNTPEVMCLLRCCDLTWQGLWANLWEGELRKVEHSIGKEGGFHGMVTLTGSTTKGPPSSMVSTTSAVPSSA